MGNTYTVQILSDKEFDSLPYKGISDSLGIADKKKGLAFVRDTGVKEFNLATLSHEIDHLVSKHTNHLDEYGIAHKKGGVARSIVPILVGALAAPFTGGASLIPALLGAVSSVGMNQYAQSRHPDQLGEPGQIGSIALQGLSGAASGLGGAGVSGAIAGGIKGATAAGTVPATSGFLGRAGGAVSGAIKGGLAGANEFAPAPTVPGAITAPALKAPGLDLTTPSFSAGGPASILAKGGLSAPSVPTATASALPGILGNAGNINSTVNLANMATNPALPATTAPKLLGGVSGGGATTPTPQAPAASSFMDKVGQFATQPGNLLGAGSLAASMAPKTPQFEMPPMVSDLRSKLMTGEALSPLGQQARTSLSEIMKASPTELYAPANDAYFQATLANLDTEYQKQKKALAGQWNSIDPNYMQNGEYITANSQLDKSYMEVKNNYVAQEQQRRFELSRTAQYQAIQESLGVDKNQMDDLVGLTGLSTEMAAQIYGAQVADVKAIRESLGTLGIELLSRQGKMQSSGGININVGK